MSDDLERGRRVAIVHDFFVPDRGGERVAVELAHLFPEAPVYTSFFDSRTFGDRIDPARVHTWPVQRLVGPSRHFRAFLPLYPMWFGRLDLTGFDLVISSSVAFSHAVRTHPKATHVSYVHTPMRYAWDLDVYLGGSSDSWPSALAARTMRPLLQRWDRSTAGRPSVLVANSETVRARVRRVWNREAAVIHPPVDVDAIPVSGRDDGFLLIAARMLAYRRIDLAIQAANRLERELVVVGDGPEDSRLRAMAGPTIRFTGHIDRAALLDLFARCHAYVVPGIEDFGIAPVEAMAAGKPVVAYGSGGVTETVVDGETGVFFTEPTADSLAEAIMRLDAASFVRSAIHRRAETFGTAVFRTRLGELLDGIERRRTPTR